jgi:hypothetical protein
MKITTAPLAVAATLALLAGCSKPATDTANQTANAASDTAATATDTAASAAGGATDAGGAVSPAPSSAGNDAVNTDANKTEQAQAAASNSFTEGQAKGHIENAGYTDVSGLTKTPEGMWTGTAKKGGKTVSVSVDFKGAVTTK